MTGLTPEQLSTFRKQGYLVVENLFDPEEDLDPIIAEYEGVLDGLARDLHRQGAIASDYADLPFGQRLIKVYSEGGRDYTQHFDFCLPQKNVTRDTPIWLGRAVFNVIRSERLLDVVKSVIGGEIFSNPVQHVRLKTPDHLTPRDAKGRPVVPNAFWHQDNGVVTPDADETEMLTVWTPLLDATAHNGCLQLVPGSHMAGLLTHCPRDGILRIPGTLFAEEDAIPVPVRKGSALLMNRRMCHASMINHSNDIRWSFDLRYNPVGQAGGRDVLPGFVARSRRNPATEQRDWGTWVRSWHDARDRLADRPDAVYNRWSVEDPMCA